jgi:NAD(P)-dependent dehydrogenase (short-subunit alcohol dehydrogenase family)
MEMGGQRALVIGASGGFGGYVARALSARGARLVVSGRDVARLDAIAGDTGATAIATDLVVPGAPDALVEDAVTTLSGLDIVVMSAGAVAFGPVVELDDDVLRRLIDIDLVVPILVSRAAARALGPGGVIVNVSAVVADQPMAGLAAYSAAKAGLTAFDTAFRREMRRAKIRVLDARPPHMETDLANHPLAGSAPGLAEGRDPAEIAGELVAAIAGDETAPAWVT